MQEARQACVDHDAGLPASGEPLVTLDAPDEPSLREELDQLGDVTDNLRRLDQLIEHIEAFSRFPSAIGCSNHHIRAMFLRDFNACPGKAAWAIIDSHPDLPALWNRAGEALGQLDCANSTTLERSCDNAMEAIGAFANALQGFADQRRVWLRAEIARDAEPPAHHHMNCNLM